MLLGNDERNLADFPNANTWEDVVSRLLDMDGSSQANTMLERIARVKEGRSTNDTHSPASGLSSTSPAARGGGGAARGGGQVRGSTRGGDTPTELPDEVWKDKFEALKAQIKPTEIDLMGCTTYQQKLKRTLAIRDSRARENELKQMRGGLEGLDPTASKPATKSPSPANKQTAGGQTASPSRSQLSAAAEEEDARVCYNCNQKGHLSKNCPQPKRAGRRSPSPAAEPDA